MLKQINADKKPGVPIRDVITIRNRVGNKVITLGKVIRKAASLGYCKFFCIFCWSQMVQDTIQFQGFKPLNDLRPADHPDQKMVSGSNFKA